MAKVKVPTPLQKLTKGEAEVAINAADILELIKILNEKFPGIKERICDEEGNLRRFVNIYINEEDIRFLNKEYTVLKDRDIVSIFPAIAGGAIFVKTKDNITKLKRKILPIIQSYEVKKAALFGSFVRGEAGKNSDIDMLVEFKGAKSLFDLVGLKIELEELLKRKVDVLTYKSLHPLLKKRILNEQKIIYG